MAQDVQISCVNKTPRMDPHLRISNVGGINPDGTRWRLTLDQAIAGVKTGKWRFWTTGGGTSVWVVIAKSQFGNEYLKTMTDGEQPNNLLSLPACPV